MDIHNKKTVKYQPYLNYGLNTVEDVLSVFTKYSDGGYWVKKIDHKLFYREIVEGPFTKKEAEKKAKFWSDFFIFKDIPTARAYSFTQLVCMVCDVEYNKKLKNYIFEDYIWQPPRGASLMCLLAGKIKVLMNSVFNVDDDFEKFELYVNNLGVVKTSLFEYDIFYLEHDLESNYKATTLRRLVSDYYKEPDQLVWLYDEVQGFLHTRGCKPFVIPGYIVDSKKFCMPLELEFFKKYNKVSECKKKRKNIFEDLKKCLPDYSMNINAVDDKVFVVLNIKLIIIPKTNKVKDFFISMDDKNNMIFGIVYTEDQTYMKVEETENCRGKIITNLDLKKYDNTMWLIIYLAKVFGFTHLTIFDDFKNECENHTVYHNILLYLDDQPSYYEKFNFKLSYKDEQEKLRIISKYREEDINNYIEDQIFQNATLKDVVRDYFNGMNKYSYVCETLEKISEKIYKEISICCLKYTLELKNTDWNNLLENIN